MAEKEGCQFHLANKNMKTNLRCKNTASVHMFLVLLCPLCVYLPVCFPKERETAWYWMGREVGRTWEVREGDCDQKNKTKHNFQLEKRALHTGQLQHWFLQQTPVWTGHSGWRCRIAFPVLPKGGTSWGSDSPVKCLICKVKTIIYFLYYAFSKCLSATITPREGTKEAGLNTSQWPPTV